MNEHHGPAMGRVARVVTGGWRLSGVPLLAVLVLGACSLLSPAEAAFPGRNGQIAFTSVRDGNSEIFTMAADGSNPVRRTTNAAIDVEPVWSPDGTRIAFVSTRDVPGNYEIYTMAADGLDPARRTTNAATDFEPAWSPDGTRIAFSSQRDGNSEIYTMAADGSDPVRLTTNAALDHLPAWSPDGTRIAFTSFRDGNSEIYTMTADGSDAVRRTTNAEHDGEPAWSPDGTRIAFTSFRDGNSEIYTMTADGSDPVRRTTNAVTDHQADWQPIPIPTPPPLPLPPPPPPPPPAPVAPPPPVADVVVFSTSAKSLRVSRTGRFTYRFVATPLRRGKISLKSTNKVKIGAQKRIMKLAAKSFTAAADAKVKVSYTLSKRNLKALKNKRQIAFKVTATLNGKTFTTKLTLKAPRKT